MVAIVALLSVSLIVGYFLTDIILLVLVQSAAALVTIVAYSYECLGILQVGNGSCIGLPSVLIYAAQNVGVVTAVFLLINISGKPIRAFLPKRS